VLNSSTEEIDVIFCGKEFHNFDEHMCNCPIHGVSINRWMLIYNNEKFAFKQVDEDHRQMITKLTYRTLALRQSVIAIRSGRSANTRNVTFLSSLTVEIWPESTSLVTNSCVSLNSPPPPHHSFFKNQTFSLHLLGRPGGLSNCARIVCHWTF